MISTGLLVWILRYLKHLVEKIISWVIVFLVQGLWISSAICMVTMPLIYALAHNYHLSGAKTDICQAMLPYVHAILPSFPLNNFLFNTMQKYWQAQGVAKAFTIIIVFSNILNYPFDEALVLGHFGIPALGAAGVGYSTLLCRVFAMLSVVYISARHWKKNKRPLPKIQFESIWCKTLKLGIPSFGQLALEVFAFNFTTVLVASLGAQQMATHHIILSLSSFTFMIPLGQSVSTAVGVGYHIGKDDHRIAEACGWLNIIGGSIFMLSSAAMFLIFPET